VNLFLLPPAPWPASRTLPSSWGHAESPSFCARCRCLLLIRVPLGPRPCSNRPSADRRPALFRRLRRLNYAGKSDFLLGRAISATGSSPFPLRGEPWPTPPTGLLPIQRSPCFPARASYMPGLRHAGSGRRSQ